MRTWQHDHAIWVFSITEMRKAVARDALSVRAAQLRAFARAMGDVALAAVSPEAVRAFIAGPGPVTTFWRNKWVILGGFYRFALSRGFATTSPVPVLAPRFPPSLTPYI